MHRWLRAHRRASSSSVAPLSLTLVLALAACGGAGSTDAGASPDAAAPRNTPASTAALPAPITADAVVTRAETRDRMIAAIEMQLSGEPLAEAMGRILSAYHRSDWHDFYFDPARGFAPPPIDVPGYASAVESYEYSKFAMNMLAFESGAGVSLLDAPGFASADAATTSASRLRARVLALATASNATSRFVHPGDARATNPLGWPGLWPVLHPFAAVDPGVNATSEVALNCSITSDDDVERAGAPLISDDYECDYTSLHLPARDAQTERVITPGGSGWAAWKYALWAQNYLQRMHDGAESPVTAVPDAELARVGAPGNTVQGTADGTTAAGASATPTAPTPGTFLGSSDIEGFQAGLFLDIVDQQAAHWLFGLSTTDGATLGGFRDLREALAYGSASPLRWFPAQITVDESPAAGASSAGSPFPRASAFHVRAGGSDLLDLAGLMGAYATAYALTDHANPDAGGSATARAYFDGDPFADDDQQADGEPTLHDRALAMLRVLVVNVDRMHRDPGTGLLVDRARVAPDGTPARDGVVSTDAAAYALVGLRAARRALGSELALYGNTHPDTAGVPTPLDVFSASGETPFGARLARLIADHARAFLDKLTDASGRAFAGWDLSRAAPTDDGASLDAHTAALRGLYTAFLATGDVRYRDRARAVYARLERDFYDPAARVYRARAGENASALPADVTFTPRRFALLTAALRDTYELVAAQPGQDALRSRLEARIGRLDKLVLNGWDDRNADGVVQWPDECARVVAGLPRGGLQLAERTLTGETGSETYPGAAQRVIGRDRDYDCVPEVSAAGQSAVLAGSITFHVPARAAQAGSGDDSTAQTVPPSPAPFAAPSGPAIAQHSGPLAVSADGRTLFVAHPDADSVSLLDTRTRAVVREVPLGDNAPARDPATGRFDPAVAPRAVALDPSGATLYVTGQRSGRLYAVDTATGAVRASREPVCAEPVGVLVARDGARVYVACSQDDQVVALASAGDLTTPVARVATARKPWTLAWAPDGRTLLATHLLGPGVSAIDTTTQPSALAVRAVYTVPDGPAADDPRVPHGQVRGLYDALVRPGTNELWVLHTMLGTDTPQPALDFERTVFPAVTVLDLSQQGRMLTRLSVQVKPRDTGALGDVVSGPRAIAFSADGARAFVADQGSEDLLVVDAARRVESGLVRPLPGHLPEGLALAPGGDALYLYERNSEDVVAFRVAPRELPTAVPAIDGAPVATLARDPMPAELRLGQKLFFSANSDDVPTSRDHWVSCASCHLEGRSDAVTWRFSQGPRDTPSNAGGTRDTGFLFRTAARNRVQDYWRTINVEQGGHMSATAPAHGPLLDALAAYVNDAIPTPVPPRTDPALRARGEALFAQVGCTSCHSGPARTDSGAGNPGLDLAGPIALHDVGTCARDASNGAAVDMAHTDIAGHPRAACAFDTPALRGLTDSAPYLHDGSAATLEDVVRGPAAHVGAAASALSGDDVRALVEYLRGL